MGLYLYTGGTGINWFSTFEAAAKTFVGSLWKPVFGVSSGRDLFWLTLINSCASALSRSQSLKSKTVGCLQHFVTEWRDHDSFIFGGNFEITWFKTDILFNSCSYPNDFKTATRLGIQEAKPRGGNLKDLRGGNFESFSRWAATIVCGCPNFLFRVFKASL